MRGNHHPLEASAQNDIGVGTARIYFRSMPSRGRDSMAFRLESWNHARNLRQTHTALKLAPSKVNSSARVFSSFVWARAFWEVMLIFIDVLAYGVSTKSYARLSTRIRTSQKPFFKSYLRPRF